MPGSSIYAAWIRVLSMQKREDTAQFLKDPSVATYDVKNLSLLRFGLQ